MLLLFFLQRTRMEISSQRVDPHLMPGVVNNKNPYWTLFESVQVHWSLAISEHASSWACPQLDMLLSSTDTSHA